MNISACCSKENKCFSFLADIINPSGFILENNGHFYKSNQQHPDVYLLSLKFMLHSEKKQTGCKPSFMSALKCMIREITIESNSKAVHTHNEHYSVHKKNKNSAYTPALLQ